jgi:diacylglycerol kinase family enzyme
MIRRRLAACAALALGLAALVLLIVLAVEDFRRGVLSLALLALSLAAAWQGVVRRGAPRVLWLGVGALLAMTVVVLLISGAPALVLASVGALALSLAAASWAFHFPVALPPAPRPARPVLFYNPRSGGGKVARFHVPDEARARGIEPVELEPGTDLARLVRRAVDDGADALAMAGGDGSQAVVAGIAAERGLPYACIPAGTRNHFALDLGVDVDDVVGALDAFVEGCERRVDLGEVNGRAFVNNVSVGVYGEAVQRAGYRGAKLRTMLDTVPDVLGPGRKPDLRWRGPDGVEHEGGAAILVSNNRYRFERPPASGVRPRLDEAVLGVTVLSAPGPDAPVRGWSAPSFEVDARAPVPAGVDGEALILEPPVRFRVRPAALRCRIARHHRGASPSTFAPDGAWAAVRTLAAIATGRVKRAQPPPQGSDDEDVARA